MKKEEELKILRKFILKFPDNYFGGKFLKNTEYEVILYLVNNLSEKSNFFYDKLVKNNSIPGGMEGLKGLVDFAYDQLPKGVPIHSLRMNHYKDTPYLIIKENNNSEHKYSLLFPERIMPRNSIIVLFKKLINII